jgi:acetyl esterase/lipase
VRGGVTRATRRVRLLAWSSASLVLATFAPAAGAADAGPGAPPVPDDAVRFTTETVEFAEVGSVPLLADAYLPDTAARRRPAIVLVHGGSWLGGDRRSMGAEASWLAQRGYVAFTIDYRLAPTHRFPAAVDDVRRFVRWLRKPAQMRGYRVDPARVGALGSSAGGHLTAMLGTLGSGARTKGARVAAVVSWSGPMDLTDVNAVIGGEAVTTFLGCAPPDATCMPTAREASATTHVDPTDAPTLLFTSDAEIVPLSQAEAMDAALSTAGVEHDLVVYAGDVHAQWFRVAAWPETVAFFERHLGPPPTATRTAGR